MKKVITTLILLSTLSIFNPLFVSKQTFAYFNITHDQSPLVLTLGTWTWKKQTLVDLAPPNTVIKIGRAHV